MIVIGGVVMVWGAFVGVVVAALRAAPLAGQERQRHRRPAHGRWRVAAVLAVVAMSPLAVAQAHAQGVDAGCEGAGAAPQPADERALEATTLCLINQARTRRNLPTLDIDGRLVVAARRQSADMVARGYFSHQAPGGSTLADRLRRAGYVTRRCAWHVRETLAWGSGDAATPDSRVRAWMSSRRHRKVLINPVYRDVGVGIVVGRPDRALDGFTYSAEFGRRRCPSQIARTTTTPASRLASLTSTAPVAAEADNGQRSRPIPRPTPTPTLAPVTGVQAASARAFTDSVGVNTHLHHSEHASRWRWDEKSRADGFNFKLVEGPPAVQRLFDLTSTTDLLPFVKD